MYENLNTETWDSVREKGLGFRLMLLGPNFPGKIIISNQCCPWRRAKIEA